jgi:O-antigen ligase
VKTTELSRSQLPSVYLSVLSVGIVLSQFANYLWFEEPLYRGQSANILLFFVVFAVSFMAWLRVPARERAGAWLTSFLILMSIAWLAHLILYRIHGDAFNYTALLYVPILLMIWWKPPTVRDAWSSIFAFAWAVTLILIVTRVLEMLGILAIKAQAQFVIDFDEARYFLPFNDLMGIEGRWPGPFGHNGDTAMMGAFLIVIAIAHRTKSSWVFLSVGVFTLLITSGRASIGAAATGIVILVMFAREGFFAKVPQSVRFVGGLLVLAAGAVFMYMWQAGATGRNAFWPAFLELWRTSPIVGVGSSGVSVSGGITQEFGHAHNLYIDELARYGLIGFLTQFAAIALGVAIAILAARRGLAGPLAIIAAYLVTGITEPRNQWMSPSVTGMLLILAVVTAGVSLHRSQQPNKQVLELVG